MQLIIARMLTVVMLVLLCIRPAKATIDWEDGFEYTNQSEMEVVWPTSCPGVTSIMSPSTTRAHSGSKSLKKHYNGHQPTNNSCWMDRFLPAVSTTIWVRFWMYMDNFAVDSIGTKTSAIYSNAAGGWASPWFEMLWGKPILGMNIRPILLYCGKYQPTACSNASEDSQNVYGGAVPQNQWVCVEAHLVESSPGIDNGVMQQWINGRQTLNVTTQRMLKSSDTTTRWQFIREYVQDGIGDIYVDDWAVSRDTRIGCGVGGEGKSDTAPGPALNLTVN